MKLKKRYIRILMAVCCIIFCTLILSACSSGDISKKDSSIVMIKNATMSTYGTGFAVGEPGEPVDTIVTSYSIVATQNGVPPKTAKVSINEWKKNLSANVVFYDAGRNIAILKLSESTEDLKPLILETSVDFTQQVFVRGYSGTGNIMSDFEKFNTTDIIQYSGNISTYDELNTIVVYKYTNEFNRALVGAPAMDKNGNIIGMCAYSLDSMNTYSQYILSTDELCKLLAMEKITYMTTDEVLYKNIIVWSIIIGVLLLAAIAVFTLIMKKGKKENKNENNLKIKDIYIKVTGGTLKGNTYKFERKLAIGRDGSKCDIVYPSNEPGISALHCTIQMEGTDYYLVDNFSKYGTFLKDGTKVVSSTPYKIDEDKLAFYIAESQNSFEFIIERES